MLRPQHHIDGVSEVLSHLASIDELKRSECSLKVWSVRLKFVERSRDAGLELGWILPRLASRRDLIQGWLRHVCDLTGGCCRLIAWLLRMSEGVFVEVKSWSILGICARLGKIFRASHLTNARPNRFSGTRA